MKKISRIISSVALVALVLGQVPTTVYAAPETATPASCTPGVSGYTIIVNGASVEKACPITYAEKTQLYPQEPWTIHEHAFYNNTVEDKNFLKKLIIKRFRVYMEQDVVTNTDINQVICTAPPSNSKTCKGEQLTSIFGGAKVTLEKSDNPAYPYMITWEYGVTLAGQQDKKADWLKSLPSVLGANPTLDTYYCEKAKQNPASFKELCDKPSAKYLNRGFNTFKPVPSKLLQMFSLNVTKPSWTATTHSVIEVAHLLYPQKTAANAAQWVPEGGASAIAWSAENKTSPWVWEQVGTDKTIWNRTDYPTSGFCQSLSITPTAVNANAQTSFTVTPINQGNGNPANLRYTWTATSGSFNNGQNPLNATENPTTTFSGAPLGTTITVTTSDIFGFQYAGCTKALTVGPKQPDCTLTPNAPECKPPKPNCSLTPNAPECLPPPTDCIKTPNAPECKPNCTLTPNAPGCTPPPIDCTKVKGTPKQCPNNYIEKRIEGQKVINLSRTGTGFTRVKYQILYTPVYPSNTAYTEITDTLWGAGNKITGSKGGTLTLSQDAADTPTVVSINTAQQKATSLKGCAGSNPDKWNLDGKGCYQNQIKGSGKFIIYGATQPVMIVYWGKVKSTIDCKKIDPKNGCGEEFINTAHYTSYPNAAKLPTEKIEGTSSAKVLVLCPYILSRAGGDVLFQSPLDTQLIDIKQCSDIKTSDDVVIKPKVTKQKTISSGDVKGFEATHKICEKSNISGQSTSQPADYQNPLDNISSLLCEFETPLSESLQKESIEKSIKESRLRVARWNTTSQTSFNGTIPKGDVFRLPKGKSLTIGNINNGSFGTNIRPVTFIVEDADITINGDINTTEGQLQSVFGKQATIALIAINGHINVNSNVETLSAVLFAQKGDRANSGKVMGQESENFLTIIGSVYGDINAIVAARKPLGKVMSLGQDQSAFTVRYDERIFFNTPPVLQDLVDISQKAVAR